jgi:hypothetical protein
MKKAMRRAAGTAVLGVALAAAAATPATADTLGGGLTALPTGGLPTVSGLPTDSVRNLATGPVSDGREALANRTGTVHAVTGTAQSLVSTATPSVQDATQSLGRALPAAQPNNLPVVGQVPAVSSLPGVGQVSGATSGGLGKVTSSLPVHTPLG